MPRIRSPIVLTEDDWREIYQAVVYEGSAIARGLFDSEEYEEGIDEWKQHLDDILAKIGPEGSVAAEVGVKRVPGARRQRRHCDRLDAGKRQKIRAD